MRIPFWQDDFKLGSSHGSYPNYQYRPAISHLPEIQKIISTHYAEEAYTNSLGLKIVLKKHGSGLPKRTMYHP